MDKEDVCVYIYTSEFDPWIRKISWRRKWKPTLVFLPEMSPWTEDSGGLQSRGSQRVGHDWSNLASLSVTDKLCACMKLQALYSTSTEWSGLPSIASCCCCLVTKSHLTLCDPLDCSPPGFSVHGIFQARILKWVAIFFSRESSWPRDQTHISCFGRQILYH